MLGFEELSGIRSAGVPDDVPVFVDPLLMENSGRAFTAHSQNARRRPSTDIGLGITMGDGDSDVRLGVVVQNHRLMNSSLRDDIEARAKGEVDFIYIGRQEPLWTRARQRPLKIGSSLSPAPAPYSGTLGCFCTDQHGRVGVLSNNHVLADVNSLPPGTDIIQQGTGDSGHPVNDLVAKLTAFVNIQFGGVPNAVDAAFAELINPAPGGYDAQAIYDSASPPSRILTFQPANTAPAVPLMGVCKTGRTTMHTRGRVRVINVNNYSVSMGANRIARFDGQILFDSLPAGTQPPATPGLPTAPTAFSAPGDSGSSWTCRATRLRCFLPVPGAAVQETLASQREILYQQSSPNWGSALYEVLS